ncbi:hypothetical protein Tco_0921936 [Tanacetum coccineum]|uniref:Cullin N-terminal domain-containing protein n=1 Tax=Tanacetum coccineum TaxID=301880 RepID=A0ABQ5CZG2_9ASTR
MFSIVDQLEKQHDKEIFQEIGSCFLKYSDKYCRCFIKSRMYMDDEYVVMTRNYFLQYTQLAIPEFRDTLIQHMELYNRDRFDSSKALDASIGLIQKQWDNIKKQDTIM